MSDPVLLQREYYRSNADQYDRMHVGCADEHAFALAFLVSMIDFLEIASILDIGSGTGRALLTIKHFHPKLRVVGIEPSPEMRAQGHAKGLTPHELIDGDARQISFEDGSFDLVCEFGALHHIPSPRTAVCEMLRVARKGVFISDNNDFGWGSFASRCAKQMINACGLWPLAEFVKTRGKGYRVSEDDGIAYSYSVFNDYDAIARSCKGIHLINTKPSGPNLYRSASHIALLGLKSLEP